MPTYERLAEENRTSRRTIADALEVLRDTAGFGDQDQASIDIVQLQLPSGQIVGVVQVLFHRTPEKTYIVSLPTSIYFQALRDDMSKRGKFEISRLHEAIIDGDGLVLLSDGIRLRAIEVAPASLPLEPSELDRRIVQLTVSIIGAEKRCYRKLSDKLPKRFRRNRHYNTPRRLRKAVPSRRFLDCRALCGLRTPPLKELAYGLSEKDPTLKKLSGQKIADALQKFGVRIPTSRPRRQNAQQ